MRQVFRGFQVLQVLKDQTGQTAPLEPMGLTVLLDPLALQEQLAQSRTNLLFKMFQKLLLSI